MMTRTTIKRPSIAKMIVFSLLCISPTVTYSDLADDLNKQFKIEKWMQKTGNPDISSAEGNSGIEYQSPHQVTVNSINTVNLIPPFNDASLSIQLQRNGDDYKAIIRTTDGYLTCPKNICDIPIYIYDRETPAKLRGYVIRAENIITIPDMGGMLIDSSLKMGNFFYINVEYFGEYKKSFSFRAADYSPIK